MDRLGSLLLVVALCAGRARAHEAPSRDELVDELRGISRTLRTARLQVDDKLAVDERSALEALNHALVAYFSEEYARAAVELTQLVSRPGIKVRKSYPEALEYLGESLAAMGLVQSATAHFRESLVQADQLPSQFARRVARLLRVGAGTIGGAEARETYRRLTALQTGDDARHPWAREAAYEFGRSLHRDGAYDEAAVIFGGFDDPSEPRYLHALYYLGVAQVARGDLVAATEAFDLALDAYDALAPPMPGDREAYLDVDVDGAAREWVALELDEDEIVGDDADRALRRMGAVIHLAAARLAAARDDDATAFTHYHAIPPGDPDFAAALSEATFVLFRRGKFAWCARMIEQLVAGRGEDLSAAQLKLWRGQLLARADDAPAARQQFRTLADDLSAREQRFDAGSDDAQRIFPTPVLAWSPPEAARGASALEANYVEQEEALEEAQAMLRALLAIQQDNGALPAVVAGRALTEKLRNRMERLAARLDKAQAAAHKLADPEHGVEHPEALATLEDIARLRDSYSRLEVRLTRYGERLSTFDERFRARLQIIVAAEAPNLTRYASELSATRGQLVALSSALRGEARANLASYAAEALFGEVDVAYWRKEAVTSQIADFVRESQRSREPLEDVRREADAIGLRLDEGPPPPEPPAAEAEPATETTAPAADADAAEAPTEPAGAPGPASREPEPPGPDEPESPGPSEPGPDDLEGDDPGPVGAPDPAELATEPAAKPPRDRRVE